MMSHFKHLFRTAGLFLLLCIMGTAAFAADSADTADAAKDYPPLDSKGSITITIKGDDKEPLPGGSLVLRQVATVTDNNGYSFELTKDFAAFQEPIGTEKDLTEEKAKSLAQFAGKNNIKGTTEEIGEKGSATFSDLSLGLYLVEQAEAAENHTPVDPFLVTLPMKTDKGWELEVDASPKPSVSPGCTPVSVNPPIEKKLTGTDIPDTTFRFSFKRLAGSPMAVNAQGLTSAGGPVVNATPDEMILQIQGSGSIEIGDITFTEPGKYTYLCSEQDTGEKDFVYDKTEYWLEVEVTKEGSALKVNNIRIKKGGANGTLYYEGTDESMMKFTFNNGYKTTPPPETTTPPPSNGKTLPQTGQLWWPVLALVAAGVILIIIGSSVKKKRTDK